MITSRTVYRLFLACVFAAVATPAFAAPAKQFTINVNPGGTMALGATAQPVTVIVNNETPNGNSSINSMKAYVPAGLMVTGLVTAKYANNNNTYPTALPITYTPGAGPGGSTVIAVSNMSPLKPQQGFRLIFAVDVTATSCAPLTWSAEAWTGSTFGGDDKFNFLDTATMAAAPFNKVVNQKTTITGTIGMVINPVGGSLRAGVAFPVTVSLTNSCSSPAGTSVSLSGSPGTFTSNSPQVVVGSTATFSATFATSGVKTLTANADGYDTATRVINVFDGILDCISTSTFDARDLPADDTTAGYFEALAGGATELGDTAYLSGLRVGGDGDKDGGCATDINYSVVNNIAGTASLSDPLGNIVPPGFYSFTFDNSVVTNPVVAVLATYPPEWGDPDTGLPARKTLVCLSAPCTTAPTYVSGVVQLPWIVAPSCLSTLVTHSSVPLLSPEVPGCVAKETWWPIALENCPLPAPTGLNVRCLQLNATMIMGKDPIWGR